MCKISIRDGSGESKSFEGAVQLLQTISRYSRMHHSSVVRYANTGSIEATIGYTLPNHRRARVNSSALLARFVVHARLEEGWQDEEKIQLAYDDVMESQGAEARI